MKDLDQQALDSLFEVLAEPSWEKVRGQPALFLNARWHQSMRNLCAEWHCVSRFRPDAKTLIAAGFEVDLAPRLSQYPLILVRPNRQRAQNRALLASAASLLEPKGMLITAASNDAGARSLQDDVTHLMGNAECRSLNRCRVVWSARAASDINTTLQAQWLEAARPLRVAPTPLLAAPGMFSWDRVDPGSSLLAEYLPETLGAKVADFGVGWGYLSAMAMRRCAGIVQLDLYEADLDSLQQAERNLRALSSESIQSQSQPQLQARWVDIAEGSELDQGYDAILCNPPFHSGHRADPELGRQFIAKAARALRPGGSLWLVANRHLPYEDLLLQCFADVQMLAQSGAFKVFTAIKGQA